MLAQAPIVIRHGAVLIHINDPKEVGPVMDSLARTAMFLPPTGSTNIALVAHEAANAEVPTSHRILERIEPQGHRPRRLGEKVEDKRTIARSGGSPR